MSCGASECHKAWLMSPESGRTGFITPELQYCTSCAVYVVGDWWMDDSGSYPAVTVGFGATMGEFTGARLQLWQSYVGAIMSR